MKAPKTLQDAILYFSNADNCLQYMVDRRWPDGIVVCPNCGRTDPTFLKSQGKWQCKSAHVKRQFSVKVGTIFEDSPLGLEKWLPAVWLITNAKNGISSYELSRSLGVTQKTAWFMLHRIREAMKQDTSHKFGFGGPVESDETYVGPNPQRMHKDRKARYQAQRGQGMRGDVYVGKTAVHGMLDRELRQVRANVLTNVKRETLQNAILENVTPFASVYTDEFAAHDGLEKQFIHKVVNHSMEYVRGNVHTQGIENFWSLLKRGLRGTYVAVEPFHLDRYVSEQVFRFNNRATKENPLTDEDRFACVLMQAVGKRLTYAEVTGKDGTTCN